MHAKPGCVQRRATTKDTTRFEARDLRCTVGHNIKWIANHQDEGVGCVFDNLRDDFVDNIAVFATQIKSSLPRFLGTAGSKNHEVNTRKIIKLVGGNDGAVGIEGETMFEIAFFAFGFL